MSLAGFVGKLRRCLDQSDCNRALVAQRYVSSYAGIFSLDRGVGTADPSRRPRGSRRDGARIGDGIRASIREETRSSRQAGPSAAVARSTNATFLLHPGR